MRRIGTLRCMRGLTRRSRKLRALLFKNSSLGNDAEERVDFNL
jgi:hypothetical protein